MLQLERANKALNEELHSNGIKRCETFSENIKMLHCFLLYAVVILQSSQEVINDYICLRRRHPPRLLVQDFLAELNPNSSLKV